MVAVGAKGLFKSDEPVSTDEVFTHNILAITRHGRMRVLYEKLSDGPPNTSFLEVDSYLAMLELLAAGEGVALLPFSMINASAQTGRVSWAPIKPRAWTRKLILARHHERLVTPAVQAMVDIFYDIACEQTALFGWSVERADDVTPRPQVRP
jgi:DNA-binding transcriptional LysR family regulator